MVRIAKIVRRKTDTGMEQKKFSTDFLSKVTIDNVETYKDVTEISQNRSESLNEEPPRRKRWKLCFKLATVSAKIGTLEDTRIRPGCPKNSMNPVWNQSLKKNVDDAQATCPSL